MKLASKVSLIVGFLVLSSLPVLAGAPLARVKFKNAQLDNLEQKKISELWKDFLDEKRHVLLKPGKDYTVDQFCSFSVELAESEESDVEIVAPKTDGTNLEATEGYLEKPNQQGNYGFWKSLFYKLDPRTRRRKKREAARAVAKQLDTNSIKLLKHNQNYEYNLAAIEFLKITDLKVAKKDEMQPVEVEFIYLSYY